MTMGELTRGARFEAGAGRLIFVGSRFDLERRIGPKLLMTFASTWLRVFGRRIVGKDSTLRWAGGISSPSFSPTTPPLGGAR